MLSSWKLFTDGDKQRFWLVLKMEKQFNENVQISKNFRRSQGSMYVDTK